MDVLPDDSLLKKGSPMSSLSDFASPAEQSSLPKPEQVEEPVAEEFNMPISWQHFDYTELLELLGNYKRSKVHFVIPNGSLIKQALSLCPHKVAAAHLDELDRMHFKVESEINEL